MFFSVSAQYWPKIGDLFNNKEHAQNFSMPFPSLNLFFVRCDREGDGDGEGDGDREGDGDGGGRWRD
jgi:hypothetical protein